MLICTMAHTLNHSIVYLYLSALADQYSKLDNRLLEVHALHELKFHWVTYFVINYILY